MKFVLILFPLFEIAGFIIVDDLIGLLPTLLLILASSALGLILLRRQGLLSLEKAYEHRVEGSAEILHGPIIVLAGCLLLIPGFITDIIGLIILIPGVRNAMIRWIEKHQKAKPGAKKADEKPVIEGEFWREGEKPPEDKKDDPK